MRRLRRLRRLHLRIDDEAHALPGVDKLVAGLWSRPGRPAGAVSDDRGDPGRRGAGMPPH